MACSKKSEDLFSLRSIITTAINKLYIKKNTIKTADKNLTRFDIERMVFVTQKQRTVGVS